MRWLRVFIIGAIILAASTLCAEGAVAQNTARARVSVRVIGTPMPPAQIDSGVASVVRDSTTARHVWAGARLFFTDLPGEAGDTTQSGVPSRGKPIRRITLEYVAN